MADKKISELDLALLINNDAVFPMSQDNAGEPTTFKGRITQLGTKIAEDMTFSNLQTTSKKLVGAINELLRLGSPIILGTSAPTSSVGANGNLYVQYTAGTGGADDTVDGIYVKIDGAWCEIQTGGGSGTTDYEDLSNKPQVNSVELVGNKSLDDLGIMPASLSKTASGSIVHITDGGNNIPVKSLVSEIVAVQSGSGEKSPDNPYTISGFSSGVITVTDNDQITNTYTFAFGQTVYGGHFDNKGNLVVTHASVDLSTLTWATTTPNRSYSSDIANLIKAPQSAYVLCGAKAEKYNEVLSSSSLTVDGQFAVSTSGMLIFFRDNDTPTGLLVYPLANPIVLSIASQDIPTLLGENNIFSNTGDVEVTYYTDNADEIVEVVRHHYSTDEQVVGTWIDGSTVYEKTQYGGISMTEAETWYDTSIIGIDKAVMVSGSLLRSGEEVGLGTFNSRWIVRNNTVKISLSDLAGDTWSLMSITVRYTKSST